MSIRKYLLLFLLCSLSMQAAIAANRYVRPGATGTQSGSDWANAYPSLPATLVRGDTYYLAAGTYPAYTFSTPPSGTKQITLKKATVADNGTNVGWNDAYGTGQVLFSGGWTFTSSYWVVDGQTGGGAANNWVGDFGIKIVEKNDGKALINIGRNATANSIVIRHVDLQGKGSVSTQGGSYSNDGLAIYGASDVTLSHFRMSGIGRCPFFVSPRNLLVEHGWVQSYFGSSAVHSEVASIWGFAGDVGDVTFRHNLFTDIQSTGGIMWDNSSNTSAKLYVYGNVFYKPTGARWERANGVIGGWTSNADFRNALVYNNSFVNVDQQSLSTLPQTYSGNVAYNNLFYNSASPDFAKFGTHDYNHFINSGGTHSEANGTSGTADPFVNMAGLDFRLKTATTGGLTLGAPANTDPSGTRRGTDGTWDRGAFEFSGTAPATTTTTSTTSTGATTSTTRASTTSTRATTTTTRTTPTTTLPPPVVVGTSLFTSQVPQLLRNSDGVGVNYELGMRFTSATPGQVRAIRFYKSPSETGTHVGKIYSASGRLLASVTFTTETASGWQVQALPAPLAISANTEYVVSVNTGNTYYVATNNGFASQVANGGLKSVIGNNGVFGPVGMKPAQSWQNSNYFRDVVFTPSAPSESLFADQIPQLLSNSDGANVNYELGMRFTATAPGQIKAIRFYKSLSESGTHVGKIYSASGQLLASVVFSNETASGWQTQSLPLPLSIAANTEYIVSVNTGNTYYVATNNGLATQVANGSLRSMVGNNGVFGPVGVKPTQSWQNSNYFRDVLFERSL